MATPYDFLKSNADDEEAYRYAQLSPWERLALEGRQTQHGITRGVEDIGRTVLGLPQSNAQNREAAGRELRELAKTATPGTAEFYKPAADILRKYGLLAEAEKMQKELHALEIGKGEADPLVKAQRGYDEFKRRFDAGDTSVKPAMDALQKRIKELGVKVPSANAPEFLKLLDAYEEAVEAGQNDRAEAIKKAMDAWIKNKEKSGEDVAWARLALAEEKEKRVAADKLVVSNRNIAQIVSAFEGTIAALDEEVQNATRLLAHPGRGTIVGDVVGALPIAAPAMVSGGAGALYRSFEGQIFIRALQALKATSKTGASGLGQLTEIEGNKIQQAKTAAHRQQPLAQFDRTLAAYIAQLQSSRAKFADALVQQGGTAPAPLPPIIDAPPRADPRAVVTPPAKRTFKATKVTP